MILRNKRTLRKPIYTPTEACYAAPAPETGGTEMKKKIQSNVPELSTDLRTSDFLNVNPMKLLSFDVNICKDKLAGSATNTIPHSLIISTIYKKGEIQQVKCYK